MSINNVLHLPGLKNPTLLRSLLLPFIKAIHWLRVAKSVFYVWTWSPYPSPYPATTNSIILTCRMSLFHRF